MSNPHIFSENYPLFLHYTSVNLVIGQYQQLFTKSMELIESIKNILDPPHPLLPFLIIFKYSDFKLNGHGSMNMFFEKYQPHQILKIIYSIHFLNMENFLNNGKTGCENMEVNKIFKQTYCKKRLRLRLYFFVFIFKSID